MKNLKYPVDNSFCFCLEDGSQHHLLAGTYCTLAEQVEVISEPFKMPIERYGNVSVHEFVLVEHDGKRYCVLNHLSETQPVKIETVNDEY